MNYIAYNAITLEILAVAPSMAGALQHARAHPTPDVIVNTATATDALATAVTAGAARHWGFDTNGVACLPPEIGARLRQDELGRAA